MVAAQRPSVELAAQPPRAGEVGRPGVPPEDPYPIALRSNLQREANMTNQRQLIPSTE